MQEMQLSIHKAEEEWSSDAYYDSVHGKPTLRQLKLKHQKSISIIRRHFAHLFHPEPKEKEHNSSEQNIDFMIVDCGKNIY